MAEPQITTDFAIDLVLPDALLATKLYIPPMPPNLVNRPHLIRRLNQSLRRSSGVILISAPPGFGKTTLLAEWIYQQAGNGNQSDEHSVYAPQPGRVSWLSLDDADNDPRRFLSYCIAALRKIEPEAGQTVMAELYSQRSPPVSTEALLTTLINEITAISEPFLFVLDDYHLIRSNTIRTGLAFLLDHLPPRGHLVIASRTLPRFSLTRLRSRGQLTELSADELSFTPAETATFLNQVMNLNLSAEEVTALEARTEGWIAGLQMAALSMQGVRDTAGFVKAFTGSHRYILDYLLEEVLQRQPAEVQRFLLCTSILNRLSSPLCDAVMGHLTNETVLAGPVVNDLPSTVSGQPGDLSGQTMLRYIEENNLFIVPLDDERQWYRYHQLFADSLRHRLGLSKVSAGNVPVAGVPVMGEVDEAIAKLHQRASEWYERNGFITDALHHALTALDTKRVVRLVKQKAAHRLSSSELTTLLNLLDNLPQELARGRAHVSFLSAWAMVFTGQYEAVEQYLEAIEREIHENEPEIDGAPEPHLKGEITTIKAAAAYFQRDMPGAVELCRQALALLPPDNLLLRRGLLHILGAAYGWQGHVVEASRIFTEASSISQTLGNTPVTLIVLWSLAKNWVEQGDLRQAAGIYYQAIHLLGSADITGQTIPPAGRIYISLAELLYEQNELEQASQYLHKGVELGEAERGSGILASANLLQARLRQAQGKIEESFAAAQQAMQLAQRYVSSYWVDEVAAYQAKLWLIQGNLRSVENWVRERKLWPLETSGSIPYLQENNYLIICRLLLAQGSQQAAQSSGSAEALSEGPLSRAQDLLSKIIEAARRSSRMGRLLEALVLQSLILQAQNHSDQALATLEEAFSLAEPQGYMRLFIDEGPPMAGLLRLAVNQNLSPGYTKALLAAFNRETSASSQPGQLLDPLSERELEILALIAGGMSNKELAATLFLTVGTVKWHLNNIYSKLDVRSRTQAVAKAREVGLV